MKIDRILFWFKDGSEEQINLNEYFFSLATLLNRLINKYYDGRRIKFINIEFNTDKTYELFPILPKGTAYFYGGHLKYYGTWEANQFLLLDEDHRKYFIWDRACKWLIDSAKDIKNPELEKACEVAQIEGRSINLNPDYKLLSKDIVLWGHLINASLWMNFKNDGMYSKLSLEHNGTTIFEKHIDKVRNGVGFFLEMYNGIDVDGNSIVLKGAKDVSYLPLWISVERSLIEGARKT